jgi:phytoene synthase
MLFKIYEAADRAFEIEDAYQHTAQITRVHSKTFHLATALLPHEARCAIRALYAFCRLSISPGDTNDHSRR